MNLIIAEHIEPSWLPGGCELSAIWKIGSFIYSDHNFKKSVVTKK